MQPKKAQKGFSTMQVVAALAIAGVLTAGAASVMLPAYHQAVLNTAFEELTMLTQSVRQVREYNGSYADMSNVAWLVTNGYLAQGLYTDGDDENRLGNDFTILPAQGGNNATLTYVFDTNNECEAVADRMGRTVGGLVGAPACGGATLTLTIN